MDVELFAALHSRPGIRIGVLFFFLVFAPPICYVHKKKDITMKYPENFTIANKFTQKWEKGYCNHPNDPGGATYNGVSLRFLKQTGTDINGDGIINAEDILTLYRNKDQAKVDNIFYKAFWRDPNLNRIKYLPVQVALYDTNVNTGRTQTAKMLQRACNALSGNSLPKLIVDGAIGPKTLGRVINFGEQGKDMALAIAFLDQRMDFHNMLVKNSPYPDKRDYRPFAAGWRNRVNDLLKYIKGL